jgi:hypothetical protein
MSVVFPCESFVIKSGLHEGGLLSCDQGVPVPAPPPSPVCAHGITNLSIFQSQLWVGLFARKGARMPSYVYATLLIGTLLILYSW